MGSKIDSKLGRALGKLSRSGGQFVCLPGVKDPIPAVLTNPETDMAYMLGMAIKENAIQARIERRYVTAPPAINTIAVIEGKRWRITKVNPFGASILMQLEDPKN